MNCRGPLRGEGGGFRAGGISLPPTRDKSGQAFAPRDQKGDFPVSKRASLICRQRGRRKRERRGVGNK